MELKEFTVDDCLRTMYETPSDGAKSNEGKVCIIPLENLAEEYRRPEYQLFRVSGGFGCIPGGIGRACYGRFCIDGSGQCGQQEISSVLQMKGWKESPKKWKPRGKTGRLKRTWRCERAYKKRDRTKRIARGQRLYISRRCSLPRG